MKALKLQKLAANAISAVALASAAKTATAACTMFYYQPKTPKNIAARLAKNGK